MVNFFQTDFDIYGKMFCGPVQDAVNIPIKSFFSSETIHQTIQHIASELDTKCVEGNQLTHLINEFVGQQAPLSLLTPGNSFPLVREALIKYGHTY
jgi:hypothetical protein